MNEELKVIISAEISKFKQNVDNAKKQISSFKDKVQEASKNVDDNFKKLGDGISKGMKAAAAGVAAAGAALIALGASTAEYRAEQARLVSSFEQSGSSAEQAKKTYNDLFRVLGDSGTATEAAQQLANITQEEDKLAQYTTICQGVYAKWGTAIDTAGLAEGINHTIQLGEVQGTLADALEFAGVNVDDFNKRLANCNSIEVREMMVRNALTGMYGEAAAMYEENSKQLLEQNEAQAKLQETTAKLGEVVAPVVTAFTKFAGEALAVMLPYLQEIGENLMPVLSETLSQVSQHLATTFEWVSQHTTLLGTIAAIIGGIVTAIGLYNAVAAVKAAMAAAEVASVWGLVAAYTAQAAAMVVALAPYLLIVAAIAAVIAIIVLCVKHWDEIKEAVANAWDWMKDKTQKAVETVVDWFGRMKDRAKAALDVLKTIVSSIFDGIKNNIQIKINTAKTIIQNVIAAIKAVFTGDFGAAKTAVLNIFDAIKNGITQKIENAKTTVKNVIDAIKGFFNFSWSLPKLKMPHISISGSFSLSPPSVPRFSIDWYAKGGVFDKTTLFPYGGAIGGLGENGAEAIVPLEKNTQWLDRMATMLSEKMGGARPVVLEVDGKVFAQTAINTINQNTRQTGKLALNLM